MNVPGPALLDFGDVHLKQAVQPCEQLLSADARVSNVEFIPPLIRTQVVSQ